MSERESEFVSKTNLLDVAREHEANPDRNEVMAFRIGVDLVPEWSNLVERICNHHGERVAAALEGEEYVIKVKVLVENKPGMLRDMENFWREFAKRRKLEGRWTPK